MMRRFGRRMRGGEGVTPGGFPRGGGRRRRRGGLEGRGPRLSQSERVAQIAKRRGVSTEQASELFKQRKEKRQARRSQRMERRTERVAERRGISKEDAQKLIADRRARRQERLAARGKRVADGTAGNKVSRNERIAGRKKEFLSRIREKMGMGQGKRADFEERMRGGGRRRGRGRRASNNDMRGPGGRGEGRGRRFGGSMRGGRRFGGGGGNNRNESGQGGRLRMVIGGTPGFYDRNSPNYRGGKKARQIRSKREQQRGIFRVRPY